MRESNDSTLALPASSSQDMLTDLLRQGAQSKWPNGSKRIGSCVMKPAAVRWSAVAAYPGGHYSYR